MTKIIFYDFDNTLCLWQLLPVAKRQYEGFVKDRLQQQGSTGIIRVIISTSTNLTQDIEMMGLTSYVDDAISVKNPLDKVEGMEKVLSQRGLSPDEALYFDDDADCVEEARKRGVRSICVSKRQGIRPFFQCD